MGLRSLIGKLEVKPTDDEFEALETTRWGNKDVYPIPRDKRTYGCIFPTYLHMANTLPRSAGITTPQLIGFLLFICLYFPIIYYVPPHRVQRLLEVNLVVSSPCNLVSPAVKIPQSQIGFLMVQGIASVAGTYTGGSDRVSDWTRYAKSRHAPTAAQLTALPITVTLIALIGIIATSATSELLGSTQWNPMVMLQQVQMTWYTPACRAGTFFAGVGLLFVTVFINYTQNSSGMDVAMLIPKYVSRRRGSIIFSILGVLANPWRFLTQAETFITVLSSFGVFMSPAASILVVDFWLVRRCKWNIPDLYRQGGVYWFWHGMNWRAYAAYFLGMAWALPGFVQAVGGPQVATGWYRIYQVSFFFGYAVSGGLYYALNQFSQPPGLGRQVDFVLDGIEVGVVVEEVVAEAQGEKKGMIA
ncbi:hypothetical protein M409DRAFT_66647 [Zasmidium cellare ATCC 36951]|uniref:Uncharacterized protein n=1 Tax=Zasmidium cellare ATCC 36951 TaxID=1080233 RepID=A0A6A6CHF3_ZASCE|nr:uncharacterized protein M409DRAFT_66647 [Zasmidium cellare ATCC 36951]KAF2166677.1 hypothetical protein M409DRAFT_66647 [Zasmidium cellare ATCC 36951]